MSYKEFNVVVKLGNDAMQTGADVAGALRDLADRLEERTISPRDSFTIVDVNGNRVGGARVDRIGTKGSPTSPSFDDAVRRLSSAEARIALVEAMAYMGSLSEWPGAEMLEGIAEIFGRVESLPNVGDQDYDTHEFWADIAEDLGYDHDFEPELDDEDEEYDDDAARTDAEMDRREDGM